MTEVIRLDAVTAVSSVCLSSNNVPRAFSSKWRAGLEGPERRYVQMTLSPCPNSSAMPCVQLNQQLGGSSWQDSLTYREDFQLMHGFHCIPLPKGWIPNLGLEDSLYWLSGGTSRHEQMESNAHIYLFNKHITALLLMPYFARVCVCSLPVSPALSGDLSLSVDLSPVGFSCSWESLWLC